MSRTLRVALVGALALCVPAAPAADAGTTPPLERSLVGTWRLSSFNLVDPTGAVVGRPYGSKPVGKLTYTPDRHVWVVVARRGATKEGDNALWYTGTFTVAGSTVTHRVEASSMPAAEGTDQVRRAQLAGSRLTLSAGTNPKLVLVWKRAR